MCAFHAGCMTGKFNYSHLHSQTYAEIRYVVFAGITGSTYHAFDTAVAKASRNDDSLTVCKIICGSFICKKFGVHPFYIYFHTVFCSGMIKRFNHAEVCIVKSNIFTYKGNVNKA